MHIAVLFTFSLFTFRGPHASHRLHTVTSNPLDASSSSVSLPNRISSSPRRASLPQFSHKLSVNCQRPTGFPPARQGEPLRTRSRRPVMSQLYTISWHRQVPAD